MEAIESINYKGHVIELHYDEHATPPDEWGNTDCFLVYDHNQFSVKVDGFEPSVIWDHIQETKKWFYDGYYVFPVYAYIHSGVTLSMGANSYPFTCGWDTSMAGFALVKRQKGWSWTKAKAEKIAKSVVEEWDQYCTGQVYGYVIDDYEQSCFGYYGDSDYCMQDAKAEVDYIVKDTVKKHLACLKQMIVNKVPLLYREALSV